MIQMLEPLQLVIALLAGLLLGGMFYGGLWWTVQKMRTTRRPALLFIGSLLVRMIILLLGIYALGVGHWERMVAALLGIVIARFVVVHFTKEKEAGVQPAIPERHAP